MLFLRASLLLASLATISFAAANLLKNGDFETDRYAAGTPVELNAGTGSLTGWTVITEVAGIGVGYNGNTTQEIDLSGFGDGVGQGISQSFATTSGVKYALGLDVYGTAVNVLVNGTTVASGLSGNVRTPYAFTFTATGATTTLSLLSGGGNVDHVDNVVVNPTPEPAALAALGGGALGLLRRRRRG